MRNADIEVAADWVARQTLEQGVRLEAIPVLVPRPDPMAWLFRGRIW